MQILNWMDNETAGGGYGPLALYDELSYIRSCMLLSLFSYPFKLII